MSEDAKLGPMKDIEEGLKELGEFIRERRQNARLSLRKLSDIAGISNPYLSQIERGLRRPSAQILQQLARGLRISAETLYVQAGILEERNSGQGLVEAIMAEPGLTEPQKDHLIAVYQAFYRENQSRASVQ